MVAELALLARFAGEVVPRLEQLDREDGVLLLVERRIAQFVLLHDFVEAVVVVGVGARVGAEQLVAVVGAEGRGVALRLSDLLLLRGFVGAVRGADVDDLLHQQAVVLRLFEAALRSARQLPEDRVQRLRVHLRAQLLFPLREQRLKLWAQLLREAQKDVLSAQLVEGAFREVRTIQYVYFDHLQTVAVGFGVGDENVRPEAGAVAADAVVGVVPFGFLEHELEEEQLEAVQQHLLRDRQQQPLHRQHEEGSLLLGLEEAVRLHGHAFDDRLNATVKQILFVL